MLNRIPPVQVNASALQLTGSLAVVPAQASAGGDGAAAGSSSGAVPLGGMSYAVPTFDYVPGSGGGSTTLPVIVVELSRDPLSTAPASVGHWAAVRALDSFSAGSQNADVWQVGFPPGNTTQTVAWPSSVDVRGFNWIRFRAMDNDASHPGTLVAVLGGTI